MSPPRAPLLHDLQDEVPRVSQGRLVAPRLFAPVTHALTFPGEGQLLVVTVAPGAGATTFLRYAAGVALARGAHVFICPDVSNLTRLMAGAKVPHPLDVEADEVARIALEAGATGVQRRTGRLLVPDGGQAYIAGPSAALAGRQFDLAVVDNPVPQGLQDDAAVVARVSQHLRHVVQVRVSGGGVAIVVVRRRPGSEDHAALVAQLQEGGWRWVDLSQAPDGHAPSAAD